MEPLERQSKEKRPGTQNSFKWQQFPLGTSPLAPPTLSSIQTKQNNKHFRC